MDKRFFLALLLTAAVVLMAPILFPTPKRAPVPAARADSLAARQVTDSAKASQTLAAPTPAQPGSAAAATPALAAAPDSLAARAARAETVHVVTPLAEYGFSSLGAAPISARMRKYGTLTPGKKQARNAAASDPVELARPGMPLVRYRLVVPGDTVDLSRTVFAAQQAPDATPNGPLHVTFTGAPAALPTARVTITYDVTPTEAQGYLLRTTGRVDGVAGGFLLVDLPPGLHSAEADTAEDHTHLAFAYKPKSDDAKGITFQSLDPGEQVLVPGPLTWAISKNKYFIVGLLTRASDQPFAQMEAVGGARTSKRATTASATVVQPLANGAFAFELYMGPQEWKRMVALGRDFENANPYGGWLQGVVQPFATIVMRILLWMHNALKLQYGWVLVLFGVSIRLILWPLNARAMRSSLKMQAVQPELQLVQQKYKNDPQKLQAELMKVYAAHGMSPFSTLSGCLPAIIPMPVLFALFFVFRNTIEFRGVSFLWLADISLHDPYYILPVVMGLSMFVLSWIGMRGAPPNPQAQMMSYMFPVIMTVSLWKFASGLNLYYTVQNLAALPQQWLISRERQKATVVKPVPAAARPVPDGPKKLKKA